MAASSASFISISINYCRRGQEESMAEAPFDLPRAQRWFAVELNNLAWDLLDKPGRTNDETNRMLHAAHASVHHWLAAGNELNRLRGMVLLANVYASAG